MGKPKLKSSIKALFSFGQPGRSKTMTWVCIQQTKTHSFREVYKSFNSMYYSSSSAASTSTDLCCLNQDSERGEAARVLSSSSSLPSATEKSFSASSSSTCLSTEPEEINSVVDNDSVFRSYISSKRFFFSPCTTKSIMGEETTVAEVEDDLRLLKIGFSGDQWIETDEENKEGRGECMILEETTAVKAEDDLGIMEIGFSGDPWIGTGEKREEDEEGEEGRGKCMILEMGFCKESVTIALTSLDPYRDFSVSMAEMVEAHGLREWSCLQKLLHCYLMLNDKRTHKTIVLAFVDLLMSLISGERNADHDSSTRFNKERNLPRQLTTIATTNNNNPHKEGCFP